jgi:hypothetical protein
MIRNHSSSLVTMGRFHWDPASYLALMHDEVPAYERLQDELAAATADREARTILELGTVVWRDRDLAVLAADRV